MKKKTKTRIGIPLMLACMLLASACYSTVGSYTSGTENSYTFKYAFFSGTKGHSLRLEQGDVLNVELVCEEGTLGITLQKEDAEPIYETQDAVTDSFSLDVEESGMYTLTLTSNGTKGSVDFSVAEELVDDTSQ